MGSRKDMARERSSVGEAAEQEKKKGKGKGKEKEELGELAGLRDLFFFADTRSKAMIFFGTVLSIMSGALKPLLAVLMAQSFKSLSGDDVLDGISQTALLFVYVGLATLVCQTMQTTCWEVSGTRQAIELRRQYFQAVLRQDVAWFDLNNPSELPTKITTTAQTFQAGVSAKLGDGIQFTATTVVALVIAFLFSWQVSLAVTALTPLLALSGVLVLNANTSSEEVSSNAYSGAGAVAFETISAIRTVTSLNAQSVMLAKYRALIFHAERVCKRKWRKIGFATGLMMASFATMYMVITLFGTWLLADQVREDGCDPSGTDSDNACDVEGSSVFVAMLGVAFAGQSMSQIATALQNVSAARRAVHPALEVIRRVPRIDTTSSAGTRLPTVRGDITLSGVSFAYPLRPSVEVARGYTLEIKSGQTVAIVGESGSGKSTLMQLVQRFYDPLKGSVMLDGHDLTTLNVRWLRQQIAYVGQEPKLFAGTIMANILQGAVSAGKSATREQVVEAAKAANAHDFISQFPNGYDTDVGNAGDQLSGGQKQRVAIARALIRDPKILLLDEATSALDTQSERTVQVAIDKMMGRHDRTTIVIAHRLSTVRNADVIAVVADGRVVEKGTHNELMAAKGHYYALVAAQAGEEAHEGEENVAGDENAAEEGVKGVKGAMLSEPKPRARSMSGEKSEGDWDGAANHNTNNGNGNEDDSDGKGKGDGKKDTYKPPKGRIWKLNLPEIPHIIFGTIGAALAGSGYPAWGILFAKFITVMYFPVLDCSDSAPPEGFGTCKSYYHAQAREMEDESYVLAYVWAALIVSMMVGNVVMFVGFGVASERLSARIRDLMFTHLLKQDVGFFDLPENSVGKLTTRLAEDATLLKAQTGEPIRILVMNLFSVGAGLAISLAFCWPLCLVNIGTLPVVGFATYIQTALFLGHSKQVDGEGKAAGAVLGEAVSSIRTVASLNMEPTLVSEYMQRVHDTNKTLKRRALGMGLGLGVSELVVNLNSALLFWFGGWLMVNEGFSFEDTMLAMFTLMFGMFGVGAASQGAVKGEDAKRAARNVFAVVDRESKIDPSSPEGSTPKVEGAVRLKKVEFAYPTRPDTLVCNGYSLEIENGKTIALVGPSGSGKSTITQLIERFYDPRKGSVELDAINVKSLRVPHLHNAIGLVAQEPVLFEGTVRENIALGLYDREASMEEIEHAAKMANAHDFIVQLPQKYDTRLGGRESTLSGGQKQRVAIARALIKKPSLLIFDEATSALDTDSEAVVQAALNQLAKQSGVTTIVIAHRLSTIRDVDVIAVVRDGSIVEKGSHAELLALGGLYAELVNANQEAQR